MKKHQSHTDRNMPCFDLAFLRSYLQVNLLQQKDLV